MATPVRCTHACVMTWFSASGLIHQGSSTTRRAPFTSSVSALALRAGKAKSRRVRASAARSRRAASELAGMYCARRCSSSLHRPAVHLQHLVADGQELLQIAHAGDGLRGTRRASSRGSRCGRHRRRAASRGRAPPGAAGRARRAGGARRRRRPCSGASDRRSGGGRPRAGAIAPRPRSHRGGGESRSPPPPRASSPSSGRRRTASRALRAARRRAGRAAAASRGAGRRSSDRLAPSESWSQGSIAPHVGEKTGGGAATAGAAVARKSGRRRVWSMRIGCASEPHLGATPSARILDNRLAGDSSRRERARHRPAGCERQNVARRLQAHIGATTREK